MERTKLPNGLKFGKEFTPEQIEKIRNVTKLEDYELVDYYPKLPNGRRPPFKRGLVEDTVKYWSNVLDVDLDDDPNCFACGLSSKTEREWHPWDKCRLERCHLIGARYGGPQEKWNIVLLCGECHRDMDFIFKGKPAEYYDMIKWMKKRVGVCLAELNTRLGSVHPLFEKVKEIYGEIPHDKIDELQKTQAAMSYSKVKAFTGGSFEVITYRFEYALNQLIMYPRHHKLLMSIKHTA